MVFKKLDKCDRIASTAANRVQNAATVVRKTMAHRLHYWTDDKIQPSLIAKIWYPDPDIKQTWHLLLRKYQLICHNRISYQTQFHPLRYTIINLKPSFWRLFPLGGSSFQIALYLLVTKKKKDDSLRALFSHSYLFNNIYYIQWNLGNLVANGPKKNWLY